MESDYNQVFMAKYTKAPLNSTENWIELHGSCYELDCHSIESLLAQTSNFSTVYLTKLFNGSLLESRFLQE